MKGIWMAFMSFFSFLLLPVVLCYAGDIPESLLYSDSAQVYFGEVKRIDGESITVIQRQNIKGEFLKDREYTYKAFAAQNPVVGETYLCGFLNEDNPLYIWEVTSLEVESLRLTMADSSDMIKRMEEYLNEGAFTEKEKERLAKLEVNNEGEEEEPADLETGNVDQEMGVETKVSSNRIKEDNEKAAASSVISGSFKHTAVLLGILLLAAVAAGLLLIRKKR